MICRARPKYLARDPIIVIVKKTRLSHQTLDGSGEERQAGRQGRDEGAEEKNEAAKVVSEVGKADGE